MWTMMMVAAIASGLLTARRWHRGRRRRRLAPRPPSPSQRLRHRHHRAFSIRSGPGPFPAVIAFTAAAAATTARGACRRERDWAERWVAAGHAVLLPDSFGSRASDPSAAWRTGRLRQSVERVEDVMAARAFLQGAPISAPMRSPCSAGRMARGRCSTPLRRAIGPPMAVPTSAAPSPSIPAAAMCSPAPSPRGCR